MSDGSAVRQNHLWTISEAHWPFIYLFKHFFVVFTMHMCILRVIIYIIDAQILSELDICYRNIKSHSQ